jgi:hypothetical protein
MIPGKAPSTNGVSLLTRLAQAKRLPVDFLRELGLHDLDGGRAVGIPYYGVTGEDIAVKQRTALKATEGSFWPRGRPLAAYGQWRHEAAAKAGFLIIVEGESDCWALWYHQLPALGIPGANAVKTLEREHVEAVETIYIHREPDRGGNAFVEGVPKRLAALAWHGKLFELRMPDGIKDLADLHVADSERFGERFQAALQFSTGLHLPGNGPGSDGQADVAPLFPEPILASQLSVGGAAADWLWRGYLARGSVTLLTSLWKAGKSTLLAHLVKALSSGQELAGLPMAAGRVLVVSEESASLWANRRDKLSIGDHAMFYVRPFLGRPDPVTWQAFIQHLAKLVRQRDLALVCFDTLAALSPCDDENDAAKMLAALTPLQLLTEAGAAVLLVHHPRKGDGGEGQASRGSGALPGFVDIIVEMRRVRSTDRANRQRELTAYSRFDETPAELVIELADDGTGYRSLGSPADADRHGRWQAIGEQLPGAAPGKTPEELLADWPAEGTKPAKRTLEMDLKQGAEVGRWSMGGAGRKGDPYRFWSHNNSIRADIDPIAARIESGGSGTGEAPRIREPGEEG